MALLVVKCHSFDKVTMVICQSLDVARMMHKTQIPQSKYILSRKSQKYFVSKGMLPIVSAVQNSTKYSLYITCLDNVRQDLIWKNVLCYISESILMGNSLIS